MSKPFWATTIALFCAFSPVFGQTKLLWNRWTAGANILYLGIDNELRAMVGMDKILSARSNGASVEVNSDSSSLVVRPSVFGPVTVHVYTLSDSVSLTYQSDFLPLPQIGLGDVGFNLGFLSRNQLGQIGGLKLKGHRSEAGRIYEQCRISCYEIQIAGQLYSGQGSAFTEEILQALNRLQPGEKIIIQSLFLEPTEGGRAVRLEPARVIVVTE